MGSFFHRLVALVLSVGLGVIIIEFSSPAIYHWLTQKTFDQEQILRHLEVVSTGGEGWKQDTVKPSKPTKIQDRFELYPFVGFVRKGWRPERLVNNPLSSDNTVRVGIFGASVAGQLGRVKKILSHELQKACYPDKRVNVVFFSEGGFKQPQQLMMLTYLLSLGLSLDVLINIDGLNEVGDMAKKQALEGVDPHHPQLWPYLLRNHLSLPEIRTIAQMAELREQQQSRASLVVDSPILRLSNFVLVLWELAQQRLDQRFATLNEELAGKLSKRARGSNSTKRHNAAYANDAAMLLDFTQVWKRSSLLMSRLSHSEGIAYYHFLQPNQHVTGSKPFTQEEIEIAKAGSNIPLALLVRKGFPMLSKAGEELQAEGVAFEDLTGMFKNETRTIYVDHCCHTNPLGSELLAREIARRIGEHCSNL